MARLVVVILAAALLPALPPAAQAREAKARTTYGALAFHAASNSSGFALERASSREARVEALRHCGHAQCEIVAALHGDCGAVAKGAKRTSTSKGVTRQEAEAKALRKCGEGCEIALWACTR